MKTIKQLDYRKICQCAERGKTVHHDHLMIKFESPLLEALAQDDISVLIKLHLRLSGGYQDFRQVNASSRRHQFLIPLTQVLMQPEGAVEVEIVQFHSDSSTFRFDIEYETFAMVDLVDSVVEKMIWIFGSPRSGSTWVTHDILGKIPSQIRPSDDTGSRPMDESGFGRMLGAYECSPEMWHVLDHQAVHCQAGPILEPGVESSATEGQTIFERQLFKNRKSHEALLNDSTKHVVRKMVREWTFNHVLNIWGVLGYDRVVFKAPNEGHAADLIMDALPEARLLFLMRDGRDVISSRFSPFASAVLAETNDFQLRSKAIAYYSHEWNWHTDIVKHSFDNHDPDRRLFLTYEELRIGSVDAFARLIGFAGAKLDGNQILTIIKTSKLENFSLSERGPSKPRQSGKIGGAVDRFTAAELRLMNGIMGDNLSRYGYGTKMSSETGVKLEVERARLAEMFAGVASRLPQNIRFESVTGLYHDLWAAGNAHIVVSFPYPIRSISLTVWLPEQVVLAETSRRVQLSVGMELQSVVVAVDQTVTVSVAAAFDANQSFAINLSVDNCLAPLQAFGLGDERVLGISILEIGVERADTMPPGETKQ